MKQKHKQTNAADILDYKKNYLYKRNLKKNVYITRN